VKTPSEFYGKPVIGRVTTRPLKVVRRIDDGPEVEEVLPSHAYDVIDVGEVGPDKAKVYITNAWYKEGRACLMILADLAERFEDFRSAEDSGVKCG